MTFSTKGTGFNNPVPILTILTMPSINIERCPFYLPNPTENNTGGYRMMVTKLGRSTAIPAYSPIDLAIAGLTEIMSDNPREITNLSQWFITNSDSLLSEAWVSCTISDYGVIANHSIAEFRAMLKYKPYLRGLFKRNAPFTFRRS